MVRIGDIVRFITEKLEGKVTSIVNKDIVNVFIDDYGFEIPASISDLVVIKSDLNNSPVANTTPNSTTSKGISVERTNCIYLAITPSNMSDLVNAQYELSIVNDTRMSILYTVSSENNDKFKGLSTGNCDSEESTKIGTFTIKEFDTKLKDLRIQLLSFSKIESPITEPVNISMRINGVNLCKSGNYKHSRWFRDLSWLRPIDKNNIQLKEIDENKIKKALSEKKDTTSETNTSHKGNEENVVKKNIIEIDLHIDKLLETTSGMDNAAILDHQLTVFRDTLQKYKLRTGTKIIFIHGKGDGVLRQRILWELQTKYKRYNHQDASFKQYGYGATMVTIK